MKNIFTVLILCIGFSFLSLSAYAQGCPGCVIQDTLCTGGGFGEVCVDTIAPATEGTPYAEHLTFRMPSTYNVKSTDNVPGAPFTWGMFLPANTFPYSAPIDTAYITSVTGLPLGLNWQSDSAANGNYYNPTVQPYGCIEVCGTPDCSSAGPYTFQITLTMNVDVSGLFAAAGGGGFPFPFPSIPFPIDSTFPVFVNVDPSSLLTLDVTSNDTAVIDSGESVVIDASPGFASYLWSNGDTTASIEPFPTDTTTYVCTATDSGGCAQQDSFTVYVQEVIDTTPPIDTTDTTTGVLNINVQPRVQVYPNPGNGDFTVVMPAELVAMDTRLVVYDVRGRQVYTELVPQNSAGTNKKLHLQMLGKGVYFLQLSSGKYNINHKLTIY